MSGYDAWLEAPFQRMAEQAERLRCPECEEQVTEDTAGQSVECGYCGYTAGVDWDAVAEARVDRLDVW